MLELMIIILSIFDFSEIGDFVTLTYYGSKDSAPVNPFWTLIRPNAFLSTLGSCCNFDTDFYGCISLFELMFLKWENERQRAQKSLLGLTKVTRIYQNSKGSQRLATDQCFVNTHLKLLILVDHGIPGIMRVG